MHTTTLTNADGTIVTVTVYDHLPHYHPGLILLAVLSLALIASGLYLLFRREKPSPSNKKL